MPRSRLLRSSTFVLLVVLVSPTLAIAQLATTGRWVGDFEFKDPAQPAGSTEVAIHLAVLRGRSDSTHVFYFTHGDQTRLVLNAIAGASSPHVSIPYREKCATDYFESFCSGHSTLGDGRLFIAGGEINISGQAPSGSKFAGIFDPRDYGSAARGWTLPDPMVDGRYYPTCTTMPDGTVLVTQGDQHFEMLTYGGYNSSDVAQKDARTYAITAASPFWRAEPVVASGTTQFERVGHTASYLAGNFQFSRAVWRQDGLRGHASGPAVHLSSPYERRVYGLGDVRRRADRWSPAFQTLVPRCCRSTRRCGGCLSRWPR